MPLYIKIINTLENFKKTLKESMYIAPIISKYYIQGNRWLSIHRARLRNQCTNLNKDLFHNHLKLSSACDCGSNVEDTEHYFFKCSIFTGQCTALFRSTRQFHSLSINMLLYGSEILSDDQNVNLFKAVHEFIKDTKCFL